MLGKTIAEFGNECTEGSWCPTSSLVNYFGSRATL